MLKLFAFCLDSCIVNKGKKFVHDLGTWELMEGVQSGSAIFREVFARRSHGAVKPPTGWSHDQGRFNRPVHMV
jgi:hypothetical protein